MYTCTCTVSTRQGFLTGTAWLYVLRIMYMHSTQQAMNCMCSPTHRTPHTTHTHTHTPTPTPTHPHTHTPTPPPTPPPPHTHPTTHTHTHTETHTHTAHGHHHGTIPQHDLVVSIDLDTVSTNQEQSHNSTACSTVVHVHGSPGRGGWKELHTALHCQKPVQAKPHNDHRTVIPASCV